jgi:hypothetical protein
VNKGKEKGYSPFSLPSKDTPALVTFLHRGEVALGHLHGLLVLFLRAKLHNFGARFHHRRVTRHLVVCVACLYCLFAVGVPYSHPALEHVPIVRALAHVLWQTLQL